MTSNSQPVLIIGTQRSGSNLLRLMLNQLPAIEAPHPPHILPVFFPLLTQYGNLQQQENFNLLVNDIVNYINVNPVAWHNLVLQTAEVISRVKANSLPEIFRVVYELKAETKKARYWCCKSMANIHYLNEIEEAGLQPFYIHLLRDGRDVAASFKKSIVGEKHIYFIARQWKKEQQLAAALASRLPAQRMRVLRYEDFITNPQQALEPVLQMLQLEWTDDILNFYLSAEAQRTAAAGDMWKNVIKPVDKTNLKHYSQKLTVEEIRLFETVAGETLTAFGYTTDHPPQSLVTGFSPEEVISFGRINEQLKKEAKAKYVIDAQVRVKQEEIINHIKSRIA